MKEFLFLLNVILLTACGTYKRSENPNYNKTKHATVMQDSDQDGVIDKFDKCPATPKGVSVNTKGCPKDTDGDGIADYKDRELITPSDCRPVDSEGIGKCN